MKPGIWVLRDVVFQDVGFENDCLKPLTHVSVRCEVPHIQLLRVSKLVFSTPTSSNTTSLNSRGMKPGMKPGTKPGTGPYRHWLEQRAAKGLGGCGKPNFAKRIIELEHLNKEDKHTSAFPQHVRDSGLCGRADGRRRVDYYYHYYYYY